MNCHGMHKYELYDTIDLEWYGYIIYTYVCSKCGKKKLKSRKKGA